MNSDKDKKTVFDHFDSAELELLRTDPEYAKAYLKEHGFDMDEEREYSAKFMKKIKFLANAANNKQKDQKLLEVACVRLKETIQKNAQRATEALIASLKEKNPAMQYRKLDKWTDKEIREVLSDVDLLDLLEELDKEN